MEDSDEGGGPSQFFISDDEITPPILPFEQVLLSEDVNTMETDENGKSAPLNSAVNHLTCSQTESLESASTANLTSVSPSTSGTAQATPRRRAYPPGSKGPFLVFFRPKGKPLNKLQIEKDLTKSFRGIIEVASPSRDKLRITVSDREQANKIAAFELFLMEYHVYIPSATVECIGVVTEPFLTRSDIMSGTGGFKNRAVPPVQILDAIQMNHVSPDGSKKPSNSFRITFSGSALPDVLVIGLLRLPVRLYVPTVMHCEKCQQLGHTSLYCCNKPRCNKCGEQHIEGSCTKDPKCVCCGQAPHELAACPRYIEKERHTLRSLKQRSKRSYAEILKKISPTAAPSASSNTSNNIFASLPDNDQGSGSEDCEVYTIIETGSKRKRAATKRHLQQQVSKNVPVVQQTHQNPLEKSRSAGNTKKTSPPGFTFSSGDFPSLPGASKTPDAPIFRSENQQTFRGNRPNQAEASGKMTLSGLVDIIFETLEVSPTIRSLINMILPYVKPLLKRLASSWPILDSFISFDG